VTGFGSTAKQLVNWGVHVDLARRAKHIFTPSADQKAISGNVAAARNRWATHFDPRHADFFTK
jgi:hypothetical protein